MILKFLACALGCLAAPLGTFDGTIGSDITNQSLHNAGKRFYQEALRLIASAGDELLNAQCWFFSGVYQMY
jgi:hypothetical protein